MQIAVDGPAGSGKSSVSKRIAERHSLLYLDTGAMYRAAAWLKLDRHLSFEDLLETLNKTEFSFSENGSVLKLRYNMNEKYSEDVTENIRTPEVTALVSEVAANGKIRDILTKTQQNIALYADVIMDGRDIGTVVLPRADLKFFLTASQEKRAERRANEWINKGKTADYNKVLNDIKERDNKDTMREAAPLKKPDDAVEIDTTGLTIDEVTAIIEEAIDKFRNRADG
ncbi:MAG: (d)CMP kinase [Deferribacteraceae bacterium]|jgi:cytidylate kinase|nr:(d)CMP kinase [Deferribacteraceae bacterium]